MWQNFHTIKSILNDEVNTQYGSDLKYFHTIKSILNRVIQTQISYLEEFPYY